jgi:P4 family phage/plasmid primase-like protien
MAKTISDLNISAICKNLQALNLVFSYGTMTETQQGNNKPKKSFTFTKDWQKKTIKDCNTKATKDDNTIALHTGTNNNILAIDWDLYDWDEEQQDFMLNGEKLQAYNDIQSNHDITTFKETSGNDGEHWIYKYDPAKVGGIIKGGKLVYKKNKLNCGDLKSGGGCLFFSGSKYKAVNGDVKEYTTKCEKIDIQEIPQEILEYFVYEFEGVEQKKPIKPISNESDNDSGILLQEPETVLQFIKTKKINNESDFLNVWLSCLDYNDYETWINVLHSIKNNKQYWQLVHQWSAQSSKYNYNDTQEIINKATGVKSLGSIYYQAKNTSNYKTAFDNIDVDDDLNELIKNFNDNNIAKYFYKFHQFEYLYEKSNKCGSWFVLNDSNIWDRTFCEMPEKFKTQVMDFITKKFIIGQKVINLQMRNMDDDDDRKKSLKEDIKNIKTHIKNIGDVKRVKGAIDLLREMYSNKAITNLMLEQTHNIHRFCFLNGYINLNDKAPYQLHQIQATDYIMITTNYDYNPKPSKIDYVNTLINNIATGKHKDYIMSIIAKCMFGQNKQRNFYIFTGTGANGKSMLCDDLIKPAFGNYYKSLNASYYTQATRNGSATPDMAYNQYCRIMISSEPDADEKLQSAKIKSLTGLEEIHTRALYQDQQTWTPHSTPILLCNEKPDFNKFDKAIAQRVKIVPFTNKFVEQPKLPFERLLNDKLKVELNDDKDASIRQSFISILLEYYESNVSMNDDEISMLATSEFIDMQNPIGDFINTQMIKTNGEMVLFNDVYECYKLYYIDSGCERNKMMSKIQIGKAFKINAIETAKHGKAHVCYVLNYKLIVPEPIANEVLDM